MLRQGGTQRQQINTAPGAVTGKVVTVKTLSGKIRIQIMNRTVDRKPQPGFTGRRHQMQLRLIEPARGFRPGKVQLLQTVTGVQIEKARAVRIAQIQLLQLLAAVQGQAVDNGITLHLPLGHAVQIQRQLQSAIVLLAHLQNPLRAEVDLQVVYLWVRVWVCVWICAQATVQIAA